MKFATVALSALFALSPSIASAAIVDFDEYGSTGSYAYGGGHLDSDDFRFTLSQTGSFEMVNYLNDPSIFVSNGTPSLFLANYGDITMTNIGGNSFSLQSFDLGGSWSDTERWASAINVIGNFAGGGQTSSLILLPSSPFAFSTVSLSGFSNLSSVIFQPLINPNQGSNNYEFQIDNLVVNADNVPAVPEPATWTMMIAGFSAVGATMRRRKPA